MTLKARLAANDASVIDNRGSATPLPYVDLNLALSGFLLTQFIGHRLLPAYPVATQSGALPISVPDRRVYTIDRDANGYPIRVARRLNGVTYFAKEASLENVVADDAAKTYFDKSKAYLQSAQQTSLTLLLAREAAISALLLSVGDTIAAATVWSDDAANPIAELTGIIEDRATLLGVDPMALAVTIPAKAWKAFKKNANVQTYLKTFFQGQGITSINATEAQIAGVLGVGQVIVARAQKDTSNPNKTQVLTGVWDRTQVLVTLISTPEYESIGLGKMFTWAQGLDGSDLSVAMGQTTDPALGYKADMYRDERAKGDVVRVADYKDLIVTNALAQIRVTGVIANNYV